MAAGELENLKVAIHLAVRCMASADHGNIDVTKVSLGILNCAATQKQNRFKLLLQVCLLKVTRQVAPCQLMVQSIDSQQQSGRVAK